MHIHGSKIEREVEIYATNIVNRSSQCTELNREFVNFFILKKINVYTKMA
jgi:hypothetical protein